MKKVYDFLAMAAGAVLTVVAAATIVWVLLTVANGLFGEISW